MSDAQTEPTATTLCVQAGLEPTPSVTEPLAPPIWPAAAFAYPDLETMEAILAGEQPGFVYARYGVPNHLQLERALARLEGGEAAVVTASGMSAITATLFALTAPGQRVVADVAVYRGTQLLLEHDLARFGVTVELVDCGDRAAVERALATPARLLWVDTLTNPTLRVRDLPSSPAWPALLARCSSWTIPSRRRSTAGRSPGARRWSCTRRPSRSAGTTTRAAAR